MVKKKFNFDAKKISVEKLLKIEYEELGLTPPEVELLKKKHSTRKHTNWMTEQNNKYEFILGKKRVVKG